MFYSYFDTRARMRPYGTAGITYGGAQSTIQAVQQALQAQQQIQQGIQPYYIGIKCCKDRIIDKIWELEEYRLQCELVK